MKKSWNHYPEHYREKEINQILQAVQAGNCVSVVGLSGSGKSNVLGFLYNRKNSNHNLFWIDGNRAALSTNANILIKLIIKAVGATIEDDPLDALLNSVADKVEESNDPICFIIDRFDAFQEDMLHNIASQLRFLRDTFKYQVCYVLGTRTPIAHDNELAELCYANTIYLGPLSDQDAHWSIQSFADRNQLVWNEEQIQKIIEIAGTYPSFMRAACEAVADDCVLEESVIRNHPAVTARLFEFQQSQSDNELVNKCGLSTHPWLQETTAVIDPEQLTAQEYKLLNALKEKAEIICSKDELIQAVWPEDQIYEDGLRDDSLAQLIRRLRKKIEIDPGNPQIIQTVPGRGYIYRNQD